MRRLRELAGSIIFLLAGTMASTTAVVASIFPGSVYIAERSVSVIDNFYILGGFMALMIVASVFQSLLVIRLIWGPAAVYAGDGINVDIDKEKNIKAMKATGAKKAILFFFIIIINTFIFDHLGRGVVVSDTRAYRVLTLLRSKDGQARVDAVHDSIMLTGDKRIADALKRVMEEPGESREWAAYAAGARKDDDLSDAILNLLKTGTPRERAAAAVALARLKDYRLIQAAGDSYDRMGDLKGDLIMALGMMGKRNEMSKADLTDAGSFLAERLTSGSLDTVNTRLTIWALGRFEAPEGLEPIETYLNNAGDTATLCIALEALGRIGAAQTSPKLIEAVHKFDRNQQCPETVYADFTGHEVLLCSSVNIIERLLYEIAHIGDRRAKPDMEKLAKDESFSKTVRNLAGEISFQMKYLPVPADPIQ
jgi:hypothetical protein